MNNNHQQRVSRYIKAKDNNKPHLMEAVFSQQATLKMDVQTDNISFPADVSGVEQITQTLVCEFNSTYENIYTLCLADTLQQTSTTLNCRWLVCMTEKVSGALRVGFGDYRWRFEDQPPQLACELTIVIDTMTILPDEALPAVMHWFDQQPYPWTRSSELLQSMPDIQPLTELELAGYLANSS
ncbi:MAG: hypothetical protein V7752_14455 [Halopseudomonas sp.]